MNSGKYQTALGYLAGSWLNSGNYQTAVGYEAGYSSSGDNQTAVGYYAGYQNSADYQTAVGYEAGKSNTTTAQTVLGYWAGYGNSANYQTAAGYKAGGNNSGSYQTAVGYEAGYSNSGDNQTAVGYLAGAVNKGVNQTVLGFAAGFWNDGNNVVAIGYEAGMGNSADNQFILKQKNVNDTPLIQGNFSTGNIGIGTTDPGADKLDVRGRAYASGRWQTTDADYAEWFEKEEEDVKPGDIVGVNLKTGKVRKYRSGDKFIGICTSKSAFVGNRMEETDEEMAQTHALIGLLGQLEFNKSQVIIDNREVKTIDGKTIGTLLSNGKVFIGR